MPSSRADAGADAGTVAALERAKAYPYDVPESCYALAGGGALRLVGVDLSSVLDCEVLDDGRVTSLRTWARRRGVDTEDLGAPELLLAYGSNASVAGLSRKLADDLHGCLIPVARATLADFEVVYSAHLSSYGAVPATLQHSPGARTNVSVLLTTRQNVASSAGRSRTMTSASSMPSSFGWSSARRCRRSPG